MLTWSGRTFVPAPYEPTKEKASWCDGLTMSPAPSVTPVSVPPALDLSLLEFSPDIFSGPQPPGTDSTDTDLFHSLLAELGPEIFSLTPSNPSLPLPHSPMLVHTPPPAQVPLCPPTPSPSLTPTTPFSSTYSSAPSSVPEAPAHDTEIDDPFLVSFADLDGLLKDSTLFENPTSASPCSDVPFVFPLQEDGLLQDLSEFSLDLPQTNPTLLASLPSPEASILHDHTYTSSLYSSTKRWKYFQKAKGFNNRLASLARFYRFRMPSSETEEISGEGRPIPLPSSEEQRGLAGVPLQAAGEIPQSRLSSHGTQKANAELRERARQMEAEAEALRKKLVQKLSA
ncbi:hypothetical protein GBAR_LOCUS31354 [Geodia barretti]|uniref:Uncharacterized protein n=1 Tax=Geodia barretti TaxID=519541 RepID=A0AA35U2N1_GEOBA|nr:hypothetical protein GBAR_LOCUS31354 [Geodia barretti]